MIESPLKSQQWFLHAPINRADYFDEVGVFLGASYFRAVAKGQNYGLSARGLAINTAEPSGEGTLREPANVLYIHVCGNTRRCTRTPNPNVANAR